jgi:hypothetical protein
MKIDFVKNFLLGAFLSLFAFSASAQEPTTQPTPPAEEPIKVFTEEVHLNVTAHTSAENSFRRLSPMIY